ncbi:MAG: aspartyl protease family protein [Candidatus Eremiobacteraeota bacterium]|nr:aspartyl protease family protein [Candidatus Eremiobacteraeota bacterium]
MNFLRFAVGALALAVLTGTAIARADSDMRVAQLVAASGQALGISSLASVSTLRFDATVSAVGLHGRTTQYLDLRNGRFAESTDLGSFIQLDGYDGRVAWSGDGTHLVWNAGGDSDRASEINQAYLLSYALWKPQASGAAVAWLGTKSAGGRSYDALSITPVGSKVPFELWFDRTTHLPARANFVNGFTTSTLTFSQYRRTNGLNVAYAVHVDSSDGNNADTAITRVTFDPPGAQVALARPQTHPTDFSMENGKASTTIPIELEDNHVYLNVMLNGKGPYRFIFDTGGANIVDPAVAKEIGAVGSGSAQGSGVGSQTESFSFAHVSKLQVGDATLTDQFFGVVPTRMGFGVSAGRPVDGLIGWEVLARYITTFDYANRQVVLSMPGTAQGPPNGHVVPFVLDGTQPQVACTVDGIPAECTIDTGARNTISFMTPFVTANPQIMPATVTAAGINGFGIGGPSIGKLGRVQTIGIDDLQLNGLIADYSTQTAGAFAAPFVAANIGGNLLRRFTVTFDYGRETMTLVPNADFAQADAYERSGLFLIKRANGVMVLDSRPGTPAAAAGIVRGDTIDAVNGSPASAMQLSDIRNLFAQPAGTVVTLQLTGKDGTKRTVKVTLRDYV